eukprot:Seg1374.9 transcript_id=Seg1374.9/GoldUCD/mRNA.D3Y31 product="Skeletal aspartic acid-rich protein 2" protein_id=Seg1374.9/GoldUCD/D3Y31
MKTILFLIGISCCYAVDKELAQGDTKVKIMGQSGKMTMSRGKNSLMVTFDYIKELDKDDIAVGTTGSSKHSINSFASQSFTFTTSGLKTEYQNISVKHIKFEASISGPGAKLVVDVFIFNGTGNVKTSGNETLEVGPGTIKFNIGIESWNFCGGSTSCRKGSTTEIGTQVELGIEIKGRKNASKKSKKRGKGKRLQTLDLGDADCTLSGEVNIDGLWKDMVSPFPKVEVKGAKQLFIFRFPKFSTKAIYDPTVHMSTTSPNSASKYNVGFHIMVMCILSLLKLLM